MHSHTPPACLLGIDVGGTTIGGVAVVTHPDGAVDILATGERPARQGADALVEDVAAVCDILRDAVDGRAVPRSIGIGTPGKVDVASGNVSDIANLSVDTVALGSDVARRTGLPVQVENDVNAAAIGAARMLGTADAHVVAFLNLGTGLAAGILRDGRLDHGARHTVGEIGHIPVERHRWPCGCGQRGCLETAGSGGAVTRLWPYDSPPMPGLLRAAADARSPRHAEAVDTKRTVVRAICDAIDVLALAVDPDLIIVGGGMARTGQPLLDALRGELHDRASASPFIRSLAIPDHLRLAPDALPLGAIGAALVAP
ncbi:ROK family protein [Bifidobacterium cuniculi]|uniref:ROK family protein n=1 Tax=Bifidobacterium cuniculi TaxID=1688 RepID=UPI000529B1E5|nr:ROK family protein [Bifidobacterium cuniculi]